MNRVRVIPIRAANGRIQIWPVEIRERSGAWREFAAYHSRAVALDIGHRVAGALI